MGLARLRRLTLAAALAWPSQSAPASPQPPALLWSEDATRDFYNRAAGLRWFNRLGDWTDATGHPQGRRGFAEHWVTPGPPGRLHVIDVTMLVRAHGADFLLMATRGALRVHSREALGSPPYLRILRGSSQTILAAEADTWLAPTTGRPLGAEPSLLIQWPMLMRFPQGPDPSITRAQLVLTSVNQHGPSHILVMRPAPANPVPDRSLRPRLARP